MLKEIKDNLRKWKHTPVLWLEDMILLKCSTPQINLQIQHNPDQRKTFSDKEKLKQILSGVLFYKKC